MNGGGKGFHFPLIPPGLGVISLTRRCRSSVVEHSLGKGEVDSSILSGSTILSPVIFNPPALQPANRSACTAGKATNIWLKPLRSGTPEMRCWVFETIQTHERRKLD